MLKGIFYYLLMVQQCMSLRRIGSPLGTKSSAWGYCSRLSSHITNGVMLCELEADKEHIWQITTTAFLVFALDLVVAAPSNGFSMPNTTDPGIVADSLGVLVTMLDRLVLLIHGL